MKESSHKTHAPSLEEQRQAILDRMQASRERYRRLLNNEPEWAASPGASLRPQEDAFPIPAGSDARHHGRAVSRDLSHDLSHDQHTQHAHQLHDPYGTHLEPLAVASHLGHYEDPAQVRQFSAARGFPRSAAVRWVMDHPLLCAAAVAAVVAIGPRKVAKLVSSGGAATALTLRNPRNIDLLTRVLTMVADVAQRGAPRRP